MGERIDRWRAWRATYPTSLLYVMFCVTAILVLQVASFVKG